MKTKTISSDRYNLIDVIRAAAIISMIAYHLCYDIFAVFGDDFGFVYEPTVIIWERTISFTFMIVSGISLNFSHHPYRRGIILNLCGFAVTAVSLLLMPKEQIWFGVLNCIGCAMIVTQALRRWLDRCPPIAGMAVGFALFAFTYSLPKRFLGIFSLRLITLPDALYGCKYLSFLGLMSKDFYSADFFPIIPWLFLYVFGYFLWRYIKARGRDGLFRFNVPVMGFIGRHSLIIYLAHQPVLYLICAAVFGHF